MEPLVIHQPAPDVERPLDVLLVDDSRLQRRILQSNLTSAGYAIRSAGSVQEALSLCEDHLPDIVLCNWAMPDRSGQSLCDTLRSNFPEDYVYFIALTSSTEKKDIAEALSAGADDILAKPVSAHELMGRILAGSRLLKVGQDLRQKNQLISETLEKMRDLNAVRDRDLSEARELQMSLVPSEPMRRGSVAVDFLLEPSGHVGGDLVGCFSLAQDGLGLFALDVSGHGIASALVTARLSSWLSGATPDQNIALSDGSDGTAKRAPHEICAAMNDRFLTDLETELYFTLVFAWLEPDTGRLVFSQAGHPHPMLVRAGGKVERLGQGGSPIGLIEDISFETCETVLGPGDRVLIYSDGVTECPDSEGTHLEEEGLMCFLDEHRDMGGADLLNALRDMLYARTGNDELPDDTSAIFIERRPDQEAR